MIIDHIGYAVADMEKARHTLQMLGFRFGDIVEDIQRNICISFGENNGYRVELISKNGKGECPIDKVLSKNGPTPYHVCYKSKSIEEDIIELQSRNFKVTVPLDQAIAFGEKRIVFMYNLSIGLIEIVEE